MLSFKSVGGFSHETWCSFESIFVLSWTNLGGLRFSQAHLTYPFILRLQVLLVLLFAIWHSAVSSCAIPYDSQGFKAMAPTWRRPFYTFVEGRITGFLGGGFGKSSRQGSLPLELAALPRRFFSIAKASNIIYTRQSYICQRLCLDHSKTAISSANIIVIEKILFFYIQSLDLEVNCQKHLWNSL